MRINTARFGGLLSLCLLLSLASCDFNRHTPKPIPTATEITIEPAELSLLDNETRELKAVVKPEAALKGKEIKWFSTKPGVVTVSPSGFVTGISAGEAFIEASVDGISTKISVHVAPSVIPAETFELEQKAIELNMGDKLKLEPVITPSGSTNTTITWESSDPTVAEISPEGEITALSFGETEITGTLTKELKVNVKVTVPLPHPAALFAKTNFAGKAFLNNNGTTNQVGVKFPTALNQLFSEVPGKDYRLPTRNEWSILVPVSQSADDIYGYTPASSGQLIYGDPGYYKEKSQDVILGGQKLRYLEQLKGGATLSEDAFGSSQITHKLAYGLRFQSYGRNGDEYAKDNRYRAAYRYDFGINLEGQELDESGKPKSADGYKKFALTITVRPLGENWDGEIDDIANEEYWNKDNEKDIKVVLPAVGNGGYTGGFAQSGSYFAPKENEDTGKSYTAVILFNTKALYTATAQRSDQYPLRLIRVWDK